MSTGVGAAQTEVVMARTEKKRLISCMMEIYVKMYAIVFACKELEAAEDGVLDV